MSQSRWIIDDERMGEASVEVVHFVVIWICIKTRCDLRDHYIFFFQEIIGGNILPACFGDSYKFHAAGREDIDVRIFPFSEYHVQIQQVYADNMKELYSGTNVGFR